MVRPVGGTMRDLAKIAAEHHGATGSRAYDLVSFSGEPMAVLAACPASGIQVVRHLGVKNTDLATLANFQPDVDILLLNLKSSGRCSGRCGERHFEKTLHRNHVTYVPGRYESQMEFPGSHSVLAIFVPSAYLKRMLAEIGAGEAAPFHSERNDRVAQLMLMLEAEVRMPGFASEMMVDGLMRAIAAIISRSDGGDAGQTHERIYLSPPRLARVIDFVETHLDEEISLGDMAEVAGLSPFHFSRVFKLATGETPYQFIGSRRLERARNLLVKTEMPLAELALNCGYSSQSHFTAAFTQSVGLSPGRYRKQASVSA